MASYLEKQQKAFTTGVTAAASKVSKPRTLAPPPASAPSPAPSTGSAVSQTDSKDLKRKRESTSVVFSQPAETGFGENPFTQVQYVIEFLKRKDEAKTFNEITSFLSIGGYSEGFRKKLAAILKKHERVQWTANPDPKKKMWDSGMYKHRPIIGVRTKKDLIAHLQGKPDAQGVSVKDLKDGWPDCEGAIDELEAEHKILVTRTKKDNHARMIWNDDASLHAKVDQEFRIAWQRVELPSVDDTVRKLLEAGQKPASEDPSKRVKAPPKPKEKKKKAPRKGGRTTNTHMQHLLKDYSHKRA